MTSERAQGTRETVPCETPDPDTRSLPQSDATRYPHPMPTEATSRNKTHPHRSAHRGNETDAHAHAAKIPIRNAPRGTGIVSPFLEQCDLRICPAAHRGNETDAHAHAAKIPIRNAPRGMGIVSPFWEQCDFRICPATHRLLPPDGILRLPPVRRRRGEKGSTASWKARIWGAN